MSAAQLTQQICCGLLTPAASIKGGKTIGIINLSLWLPDNMLSVYSKNVIIIVLDMCN